jgi:plastocyanin
MHRSRSSLFGAALVALVLVLAACSGGGTSAPPASVGGGSEGASTGETVSLAGGQFSPATLTIPVGTTVTFTDTANHTVTEGSDGTAVDDPIVDEDGGSDITVTFDEAGTFNLTCKIHANMNMTVTVEG